MDYFFGYQKGTLDLENQQMHMSRIFFCLPRNWIHLLQFIFSSYVYLEDIHKTLKGLGKIQFVSELTILLNPQISQFHGSLNKEKKLNL